MSDNPSESNTILVAHDASPAGRAAATLAVLLARRLDLQVRGLFVVDERLALPVYTSLAQELIGAPDFASRSGKVDWLSRQGDAALRWLEGCCREAGVPVAADILFGGVTYLVLREAANVRLLAIGRQGVSHAGDHGYQGQHFRAIAHHSPVPVLTASETRSSVNRLLLAYGGSGHGQSILDWTSLLQRVLPAEVWSLMVREQGSDPVDRWAREARAYLAPGGETVYHPLFSWGNPATQIIAAAAANEVDLIVMGRYRHTALLEWITGSTVDRVLHNTSLPVLIV